MSQRNQMHLLLLILTPNVETYLKEEILQEQLVRNIAPFRSFCKSQPNVTETHHQHEVYRK